MAEPKFTKADSIVNFPEAEEKIQAFWRENRIFQ